MQVLCTKGGKGSTALAELDRAHELRLKMDEKSMAQATSKTIARTLAQAQQASKEAEGRRQAQRDEISRLRHENVVRNEGQLADARARKEHAARGARREAAAARLLADAEDKLVQKALQKQRQARAARAVLPAAGAGRAGWIGRAGMDWAGWDPEAQGRKGLLLGGAGVDELQQAALLFEGNSTASLTSLAQDERRVPHGARRAPAAAGRPPAATEGAGSELGAPEGLQLRLEGPRDWSEADAMAVERAMAAAGGLLHQGGGGGGDGGAAAIVVARAEAKAAMAEASMEAEVAMEAEAAREAQVAFEARVAEAAQASSGAEARQAVAAARHAAVAVEVERALRLEAAAVAARQRAARHKAKAPPYRTPPHPN